MVNRSDDSEPGGRAWLGSLPEGGTPVTPFGGPLGGPFGGPLGDPFGEPPGPFGGPAGADRTTAARMN